MGLSFWVFYLYLQKKWWAFIALSFCLILSKETALVLFVALFIDTLILKKLFYRKEYPYNRKFFKEMALVTVPFLIFGIFLCIQKMNLGYLFFPEHTNLMNLDYHKWMKMFSRINERLFLQDTRWIWLFVAAPSLIIGIIKSKYNKKETHILLLAAIFILGYLLFSSFNFFTPRYILTLLPFLFLLYITFIYKAFPKTVGHLMAIVALGVNLCYGFLLSNGEEDGRRTFPQTVMAHKEAVNFCESQQWHDKTITTGFLMSYNLKYPQLGYLNNAEKPFVQINKEANSEIYIFYSKEQNKDRERIKNDINYELVKRIEKRNGCFVEIYQKVAPRCGAQVPTDAGL